MLWDFYSVADRHELCKPPQVDFQISSSCRRHLTHRAARERGMGRLGYGRKREQRKWGSSRRRDEDEDERGDEVTDARPWFTQLHFSQYISSPNGLLWFTWFLY
jgi:hypothetical protein